MLRLLVAWLLGSSKERDKAERNESNPGGASTTTPNPKLPTGGSGTAPPKGKILPPRGGSGVVRPAYTGNGWQCDVVRDEESGPLPLPRVASNATGELAK